MRRALDRALDIAQNLMQIDKKFKIQFLMCFCL